MNISNRFNPEATSSGWLEQATLIQLLHWSSDVLNNYVAAYYPEAFDPADRKELSTIVRNLRSAINLEIRARVRAAKSKRITRSKSTGRITITAGKPVEAFRGAAVSTSNPSNDWIF